MLNVQLFAQSNEFDPRLLLHFSEEQLAQMPQTKLDGLIAYYCESYTLDASNDLSFSIETFDISIYEEFRCEKVDFVIVTESGLVITLKSRQSFLKPAIRMKS